MVVLVLRVVMVMVVLVVVVVVVVASGAVRELWLAVVQQYDVYVAAVATAETMSG